MLFDPIDAWFEKGFRIRKLRQSTIRADRIRSAGGLRPLGTNRVKFSGGAKTANARAILKRAPEVMVKITGHSNGLNTAKHHLDYISRNGEVELENERGETTKGNRAVKDLLDELKASQIPAESKRREFLHVLFSMPPGTPEREFRESVRQFCREEFETRQYVIAVHRDTDHMHAHVCVGTRDMERADEPRLSPRKADLSRWRLGFADKLRENGIDAAASERRHRFQYRRAEKAEIRQIRADNPNSPVYNKRRALKQVEERAMRTMAKPDMAFVEPRRPPRTPKVYEALADELRAALKSGQRPKNPASAAIEASRALTKRGWENVLRNLEQAGDPLAEEGRAFLRAAERPVVSRNQALFDEAQARTRTKGQGAGNSL
ncbi:MAG: relaxase/mobilization nuclease domain-containing protein [Azoarcus sp.]|jgi:hypothetical protein|nr:relaxase/mobilization nuclease domain-containing protein [Azoarcus sp.]